MRTETEVGGRLPARMGIQPGGRSEVSPAARAIADYRAHGCNKFKEHVRDHRANGYLFSTPSLFVMAKAVALEAREMRDAGYEMRDKEATAVAWYVTYFNGDLRMLLSLIPFPLPYVAFRRYRHGRERLRVYPFDRFQALVIRHSSFVISRIP